MFAFAAGEKHINELEPETRTVIWKEKTGCMLFRRRPGHEVKKNGLAYKNSGGSLTGAQYGCREGIKLRTGAQAAGTVRKEPAGGGKEKSLPRKFFEQFSDFMVIVLLFAAGISFLQAFGAATGTWLTRLLFADCYCKCNYRGCTGKQGGTRNRRAEKAVCPER